MSGLTRFVLAHKRLVAVFWIVVALAGLVGSGRASEALETSFSMPESEAFATNQEIERLFGSGGTTPTLVAVVQLPEGTTVASDAVRGDLRALERGFRERVPRARTASYGSTGSRAFVSADGRTTFVVVHPPVEAAGEQDQFDTAVIDAAQQVVDSSRVGGAKVELTGRPVLDRASSDEGGGTGVLVETLLAGVAALVVLAFVFASALALVPLVMALVAIPTTMLAVWGVASITDVSDIVVFLVAIGLVAAIALPVPLLRSMGYGGLLIPLVSVAVALTLLPVVLATLGPRADRRRLRRTERAERHWTSWARLVLRGRWLAAAAGTTALVALVVVASGILLGLPEADKLAESGRAREALNVLERSGIGAAPLAPIEVLTPAEARDETARALAAVDGVRATVASAGPAWTRDGRAVLDVYATVDTNSQEGREIVAAVRERAASLEATSVGGSTAEIEDFVDDVYGAFPLMLTLISLVTLVLLARAFRSLLLPLKAIALKLLSVFATWGVITLVWQHGVGAEAIFGTEAPGAIEFWAPMMVFAFLYGLSMDYEVFILARMREEYDRSGSTDEAVVRGLARMGRLVTSAALIVFFAFASMATAAPVEVKVLATGLAAGVLLDATVVRTLLVPALVSVFGRWNWWLPDPVRRLLRLPPEPITQPTYMSAVSDDG